jgi:hypothetical protein
MLGLGDLPGVGPGHLGGLRGGAQRGARRRLSSTGTSADTLIVRQRPQRMRTRFVMCSALIATASTFPHSTQT